MATAEKSDYALVTPPKGKKADAVYVLAESAHVYEKNGWTVDIPKASEVEGNPIKNPGPDGNPDTPKS